MTRNDLLEIVAQYAGLLRNLGIEPAHCDPEQAFDVCGDREKFLRHVLWACERIPEVIDRMGGFLFCVRYLGCIQGGLAACGLLTVAEIRRQFGHFIFERELQPDEPRGYGL